MSFFEKLKIELEKILHHHFFGVRLRHFCGLTFMLWCVIFSFKRMTALCCGFDFVGVKYKTWSKTLKSHFAQFLVGRFWGMFWNSCSGHILVRWSSIECRRRIAQKMVAEVGRPFCTILGWSFLGDVLNFVRRTS